MHVPCEPTSSTNVPELGHSEIHVPLERNGVLVPLHVTQSPLDGPEHVPHEAWHGSQTPLVLAYLPIGMHDARQLPRRVPS